MRIGRNKSNEEKLAIEPAPKRSNEDLSTSTMERSLTTSDTIGLGLLTLFLLGLSQSMRIGLDNRKDPKP